MSDRQNALYKQLQSRKNHPFDFSTEDMAEIKILFPEFKPKRSSTRTSSNVKGLEVAVLKKKFKEKIALDN